MASSSEILAGRAAIEVMTRDNSAPGLASALARIQKFGDTARNIGIGLTGAGSAIFAPLAAAGAAFANHGASVEQGSRKTGLSADAYSTLGYASKQVGVETEALDNGFAHMSRTLAQAAASSTGTNAALKALHLTVADLSHLSQEDRFKLIAEHLKGIQDPALRASAAVGMFGRGAGELLPLLTLGSAGIDAMQARARTLGVQWSGEDAAAAGKFSRVLKDMWDVLSNGVDVVGSAVAPMFAHMAQVVTEVAIQATKWVREHKEMIQVAALVAAKIAAIASAFVVVSMVIGAVGSVLGIIAGGFAAVFSAIAAILSPIGLVITAIAAAAAYFLYFGNLGSIVGNGVSAAAKVMSEAFKAVWDAIKFIGENTGTVGEAMTAAMTIGGTLVMEAWAHVKDYLYDLWAGFKSWFLDLWNSIASSVLNTIANLVEGAVDMVAQSAADMITTMVDTAAKVATIGLKIAAKTGIDTSGAQKDVADLKSYGDAVATAGRTAIEGYARDKAQAFREANLKAAAEEKQRIADTLAADKKANAEKLADAIAKAKAAREAYEKELHAAHIASGEQSFADHFKALTDINEPPLPDLPNNSDLGNAAGKATAHGAFNVSSSALAAEIFGGDSDKEAKKTNEHLTKHTRILESIEKKLDDGGMRVT